MKIRFVFYCLLIGFLYGASCQNKKVNRSTSVYGIVYDSLNNTVIPDVTIILKEDHFLSIAYPINTYYSDSLGKFAFEFEQKNDAFYSIWFEKDEYHIREPINLEKGVENKLKVKLIKD